MAITAQGAHSFLPYGDGDYNNNLYTFNLVFNPFNLHIPFKIEIESMLQHNENWSFHCAMLGS